MVGLLAITALSIHQIARKYTDTASANIAVLAFLTSGFVIPYGADFRADPIAAALLTSSVALMLTTNMKLAQVLIVAALSGLALLVTVKASLFVFAYLAALIWRRNEPGVVLRTLLSGLLAPCVFAGLFM